LRGTPSALAPDRPDQAFSISVLPGRAERGGSVPDAHRSHPSLERAAKRSVVVADEIKREFTASNDSAIAAFENYKTYLEQELKPEADGDFALGSDLFAQRVAYNEMVDIPPDRLLDIAYAQLHKDQATLSEVSKS